MKKDSKNTQIIGDLRGNKMMIRIVFILALLFTIGCGQNLRIMWNPSDQADTEGLTHYTIYKWEGDSVQWQNWVQTDMDSIGILPHVLNYGGPYEFRTFFAENKIIRAGLIAEDSLSRKSKMGLTRFYFSPTNLEEIWIEK